jgi:hypothetical protein
VDSFGFAFALSTLGEGKQPRNTDIDPNNIDSINLFIAISDSTKGNEQNERYDATEGKNAVSQSHVPLHSRVSLH